MVKKKQKNFSKLEKMRKCMLSRDIFFSPNRPFYSVYLFLFNSSFL